MVITAKGGDCSLNDNLEIQNVSGKPGFWHSSGNGTIFSDCRKAYFGVDADKMATDRCCPIDPLTNVNKQSTQFKKYHVSSR